MISLTKREVEQLSGVCTDLLKDMPNNDFTRLNLWRQFRPRGDKIVRGVLMVELSDGFTERRAPIWPDDEQAPTS